VKNIMIDRKGYQFVFDSESWNEQVIPDSGKGKEELIVEL
ncbi:unnamed protein product, partial [marine sediment metagenome]